MLNVGVNLINRPIQEQARHMADIVRGVGIGVEKIIVGLVIMATPFVLGGVLISYGAKNLFKATSELREYYDECCYEDSPYYEDTYAEEMKCVTTNVMLQGIAPFEAVYNFTNSLFDYSE
jgi:hypothetical protein